LSATKELSQFFRQVSHNSNIELLQHWHWAVSADPTNSNIKWTEFEHFVDLSLFSLLSQQSIHAYVR